MSAMFHISPADCSLFDGIEELLGSYFLSSWTIIVTHANDYMANRNRLHFLHFLHLEMAGSGQSTGGSGQKLRGSGQKIRGSCCSSGASCCRKAAFCREIAGFGVKTEGVVATNPTSACRSVTCHVLKCQIPHPPEVVGRVAFPSHLTTRYTPLWPL